MTLSLTAESNIVEEILQDLPFDFNSSMPSKVDMHIDA